MSDRQRPAEPAHDGPELEVLLLALAVVILGPPAIGVGALLAALAQTWRRLWLWMLCLPAAIAALALWPFSRRQILAAATAMHRAHSQGDPKRILLAAWPHLWPLWLSALTLAPLIALAILQRRRPSLNPHHTQQPRAVARTARLERRVIRRAATERQRTGDPSGLFLGYTLGGDNLLPTHRGRVALPLHRLGHHLVVAGATGSGKTETVLRLAYSLAATSDWRIVYLDGKGDRETQERFAQLMAHAGRSVALFPQQRYDGWRGTDEEIANRLLQLIDFAQEGGGTYYRDLAVSAIRLACCTTPTGPPRSSKELLRRLNQRALTALHAGRPQASAAASLRPEDMDSIRARYAAFFATVGDLLDGSLNLEQIDSAYFLLDGLRLKYEAGYLARFLTEEFTQWAVARKPRQQHVLLVVDEFSALAQASEGLVQVVERTRGFGVAAALCPQVAEGMGSPEAAARIIGSTQTILLHATANPEQLIGVAGTRRVYEFAHQLDHQVVTGVGSARLQHAYRVDPDEVRRLAVGQCFAIGSGLAMKLRIAPAPSTASLRGQPQPTPLRA